MAKTYSLVVGVILLVVGLLGFVKNNQELFGLYFSTTHNAIHLITGLIGVAAGMSKGGGGARLFAQVFGVVYTLVAIAGFAHLGANMPMVQDLHLNTGYNIIHLVVGLWGLWAGFAGGKQAAAG